MLLISELLLSVRDLKLNFYTYAGVVEALDGVSFNVHKGETVGLVGETGCGKSVTALSIMGLVPIPGKIVGGEVLFKGEDLLKKTPSQMRSIRGKNMSMIFQDPMTYLNPVFTIGGQISEALQVHEDENQLVLAWRDGLAQAEDHTQNEDPPAGSLEQTTSALDQLKSGSGNLPTPRRGELRKALKWKTIEMLKMVRMPEPEKIYGQYPHELSGGMRQRAIIAMMLSTHPELLLADEPTTALDVTIQAQILRIIRDLKDALGLGMILITHDLGIVAENCDIVNIMYAGRIVESGTTQRIFANPQHPYTQGLLKSLPTLAKSEEKLSIIPGMVPSLINPPRGCRFHPRCAFVMDVCRQTRPELLPTEEEHKVACFLYHGA